MGEEKQKITRREFVKTSSAVGAGLVLGSHGLLAGQSQGGEGATQMNNVNLQEMGKFVSAVKADPAQAQKSKSVKGSWVFEEGKPQFVATVKYPQGDTVFKSELPTFAGGWGTSPDPIQYCLYGLASCFAATFVATATGEGIQLTKLEVTAENWMDLRKMIGLSNENIIDRVKFTVSAEGAPRDELERILALSEERCPGVECLTRAIPLKVGLSK